MRDTETKETKPVLKSPPGPRRWRRALRYVSRFGLKTGMQVARAHRQSSHLIALRLPGLVHPLWVRPGTSDALTFDEVFVAREYELPLTDFSPRHILDLGANVGYASVRFAARWPQARILAVEPERENLMLLKRNTGGYRAIEAVQAAVWSRAGELAVANPEGDANAFRMTEATNGAGEKVPAYTLAQLIDRLGCERLDLLKMDVEGAEIEILRDASSWLGRVNVMIIELHDRIVRGCGEALCAALHGRHFTQEILGQNLVFDFRPAAGRAVGERV
jgi:FkbM family methyltransferase